MTRITSTDIIAALEGEKCPDYAFLTSPEAFDQYDAALTTLLKRAKKNLKDVEATPLSRVTPATLKHFLSMDNALEQLWALLNHIDKTGGTPQTRALIQKFLPKFVAAHDDALLSGPVYRLLKTLEKREGMSAEQRRSVDLAVRLAAKAGASLHAKKRARMRVINQTLSTLEERFSNNTIDSRKTFFHHVTEEADLGEMPEDDKAAAHAEARQRSLAGWVFTLSYPSARAIVTYSPNRSIRRAFFDAQCAVASKGAHDNRPLILKILTLRREKARILGFKTFADFVLSDRMAGNPKTVRMFLRSLEKPARVAAKKELKRLASFGKLRDMQRWDVAYWSEKLQHHEQGISDEALQQYFTLDHTFRSLFETAEALYGLSFKEVQVRSYHPEARTFEVLREKHLVGHLIVDLFARPTKQAGAWCDALRGAWVRPDGTRQTPVVICMMNFGKTSKGPLLLKHDEVETLFHECGHALHLLLCENTEPNTSSFNAEWDFIELPSQMFENWTWEEPALKRIAKQSKTGKGMPHAMIEAMRKRRLFMVGQWLLTQCGYSAMDQMLHASPLPKTVKELDAMCHAHASASAVLPTPANYRIHQTFGHVFGGGYAAGYYSYLWSLVLEADVFAVFRRRGMFNPKVGEEFRRSVLSQGAKKPAKTLVRSFLGRDASHKNLLKSRGLV